MLIPIMFGLGTGVVTMVGTGDLGRAKRVAWTGAFLGFVVAEITGVVVAIAPTLWLDLFSHDQGVIAIGSGGKNFTKNDITDIILSWRSYSSETLKMP